MPRRRIEAMTLQNRINAAAEYAIQTKRSAGVRAWRGEMAKAAGCSYQNISQLSRGLQRSMDASQLHKIAAWAGVNQDWLIFGTGEMVSSPNVSDFQPSTVLPYSVKTYNLAPVFEWAQLGVVLFTESESLKAGEYRERPDGAGPAFKWFICEAALPRFRIKRGWRVAVDPLTDASICQDGETYLFKTVGGSYFLGDFRRLADGYEAIPDSGPPLDTARHGITVVAEFAGAMK